MRDSAWTVVPRRASSPHEECQIDVWRGYVYGEFVAFRSGGSDTAVVARSRSFRWPRGQTTVPETPTMVSKLEEFCAQLEAGGWELLDSSVPAVWYGRRFRRARAAVENGASPTFPDEIPAVTGAHARRPAAQVARDHAAATKVRGLGGSRPGASSSRRLWPTTRRRTSATPPTRSRRPRRSSPRRSSSSRPQLCGVADTPAEVARRSRPNRSSPNSWTRNPRRCRQRQRLSRTSKPTITRLPRPSPTRSRP